MNTQLKIGLWGLGGALAGNVVALVIFEKPSAQFFTPDWWDTWIAIYVVWIVFLAIGLARILFSKGEKSKEATE